MVHKTLKQQICPNRPFNTQQSVISVSTQTPLLTIPVPIEVQKADMVGKVGAHVSHFKAIHVALN